MPMLAEVTKLIVDSEHKTAPAAEGGHPMIRTPNIGPGRLLLSDAIQVDDSTYVDWTKRAVPKEGDLVLAREAPVGNVAVIPPGLRPILGQRTVLIRPDPSRIHPRYLQYRLLGPEAQHRMWSLANGATVPHLNMKDIRAFPLPDLPDLDIQVRIASVLAAYDELIENNLRRIEILEEMAQAVYREWFVEFRFPGYEDVEMVESELGPIPEGWHATTLATIADVNRDSIRKGSAPSYINYIDISSVTPRSIEAITRMPFEEAPGRARRMVRDGDTIWSTVRPNRQSFALVMDPESNTIASTGFAVLSPATVPYSFLYEAVGTDGFAAYLSNHARGAAYPAVNGGDFEKAPMVVPNDDLLKSFHVQVEPMLRLGSTLRKQNVNLRATRDLLLPKLVSGEIDVSDLDIDTDWLVA